MLHNTTQHIVAACCYRYIMVCVCLCVCWSQLCVLQKMVELLEVLFVIWTQVCPRNHVFSGVSDPAHGKGQFWWVFHGPLKQIGGQCGVTSTQIYDKIEVLFGVFTPLGSGKQVLDGDPDLHG